MYFKTFPGIKVLLDNLGRYGQAKGYITTFMPYRRIRFFPKVLDGTADKQHLSSVDRKSRNTPVQGCGADMMKVALVKIRSWLKANPGTGIRMVMTVHDQIDTLCPKDRAESWKETLRILMEDAAAEFFPAGQLKAEATISERWEK
jgi:DNA polymerase-1